LDAQAPNVRATTKYAANRAARGMENPGCIPLLLQRANRPSEADKIRWINESFRKACSAIL
jgi:hypothetical protein